MTSRERRLNRKTVVNFQGNIRNAFKPILLHLDGAIPFAVFTTRGRHRIRERIDESNDPCYRDAIAPGEIVHRPQQSRGNTCWTSRRRVRPALKHRAMPGGFQRAENACISQAYRFETGMARLQFNRLSRVCIKHVSRMHVTRQDPLLNAPAYTRRETRPFHLENRRPSLREHCFAPFVHVHNTRDSLIRVRVAPAAGSSTIVPVCCETLLPSTLDTASS